MYVLCECVHPGVKFTCYKLGLQRKKEEKKCSFFPTDGLSFSRLHLAPGNKSPNVSGLLIPTPVFSDPYPSGPFYSTSSVPAKAQLEGRK